jgi:hypothetical protein
LTLDGATNIVRWDTADGTSGQVYVSQDNGPEILFAEAASGSQVAPWLSAQSRFEFKLYAGRTHHQLLASAVLADGVGTPKSEMPTPIGAPTPGTPNSSLVRLGSALVVASVALAVIGLSRRSVRLVARAVAIAAMAWATIPVLTSASPPLEQQPFPDSAEYADAARQLATGNGYVTYVHGNGPEPPRYPPGFSLVLAPFASIGDYPTNVQIGVRLIALLYVIGASVVAWTIGGPLAAGLTALTVGSSPFSEISGSLVMSDAMAALLTIAIVPAMRSSTLRRGLLAGILAGLVTAVRLSGGLAIPALLLAAPARVRASILAGSASILVALAVFQWHTFGSPLLTGYSYWLPGVRNFDISYLTVSPPFGDGPWIVPDRMAGVLMQWICPCVAGGPQATAPSVVLYPAVLLGLFWTYSPPLLTLIALAYVYRRRDDRGVRFTVVLSALTVAFYWFYFYQGARFMAAPATLLAIYSTVGLVSFLPAARRYVGQISIGPTRRIRARLALPAVGAAQHER